MARARTDRGSSTEPETPVTIDSATALHAILAAYFSALSALRAPLPPQGTAGLNALVYWTDYYNDPDHLRPQDIPFVRGLIWA